MIHKRDLRSLKSVKKSTPAHLLCLHINDSNAWPVDNVPIGRPDDPRTGPGTGGGQEVGGQGRLRGLPGQPNHFLKGRHETL